jgi:crossover junction endodeoxyribonuclease RusA
VFTIALSYPPSANTYWRTVMVGGSPRILVSKEAKEYKREVQWLTRAAGVRQPMVGRLKVSIVLIPHCPQDVAKRSQKDPEAWDMSVRCLDVDNCVKVTLDALKGVAFGDDDQVHKIDVERGEPGKAGMLVTIEPWTPAWLRQASLFLAGAA